VLIPKLVENVSVGYGTRKSTAVFARSHLLFPFESDKSSSRCYILFLWGVF